MFQYAVNLVFRRKLRTFLTSLGITIAVILLSLIIFGMQDLRRLLVATIQQQFKSTEIYITNASTAGLAGVSSDSSQETKQKEISLITQSAIDDISKISNVSSVTPLTIISNLEVLLQDQEFAINPSFISGWDIRGDDTYFVDFYGDGDQKPSGNQVFVSTAVSEFYGLTPEELIGKTVVLQTSKNALFGTVKTKDVLEKSYSYTIIGVVDTGADRLDVVMGKEESLRILAEIGGFDSSQEYIDSVGYDSLRVQVSSEDVIEQVKEDIAEKYTFQGVFSADDILGFLNDIISIFTIVMIAFGIISGVIALIGITNTMVMSIYEQTKEIGILKAMGASNIQILGVFLIQSSIIGLIGGVVGLGVVLFSMRIGNIFIVRALEDIGLITDTFFTYNIPYILLIVGVSIVVGLLAGIYPALKAGSLDPVKALRSE